MDISALLIVQHSAFGDGAAAVGADCISISCGSGWGRGVYIGSGTEWQRNGPVLHNCGHVALV